MYDHYYPLANKLNSMILKNNPPRLRQADNIIIYISLYIIINWSIQLTIS